MNKKINMDIFCISVYISNLGIRHCKDISKVDIKLLEKIAKKYWNKLLNEFGDVDKWDEVENEYIEKEYCNYTPEKLKELIECMYNLYKKHIKIEGCSKLAVVEFVQGGILDTTEEE